MFPRFKKLPKSSQTRSSKSKIKKLKKWRQEFMRNYMKNSLENVCDGQSVRSSSTSVLHENIIRFTPTYNWQPSFVPTIQHDFHPNKTNILTKKHITTPHCVDITQNFVQGAAVRDVVRNVVHQNFAKNPDVKNSNKVININESLDHTDKCPLCKQKDLLSSSCTKRLKELGKEMFTVRYQLEDLVKQLKDENITKDLLENLVPMNTPDSVETNMPSVCRPYNSGATNPLCSLSKPNNVNLKTRSHLKEESFGNSGTLEHPKEKVMMQQLKQKIRDNFVSKKVFKYNKSGENSNDKLTAASLNCISSVKSVKPRHSKNNGGKLFGTRNINAYNSQENEKEQIPRVTVSNKSTVSKLNLQHCNPNFKTGSETTNSLGIKQTQESFLKNTTTSNSINIKKILKNNLEDSISRKSLKFFIPHHSIKVKSELQVDMKSNSDKSKKDIIESSKTSKITSSNEVSVETKKTKNVVETRDTLNQDINRKSSTKTSTVPKVEPLTTSKISRNHECTFSDIALPDRSHEINFNHKYSTHLLDNGKSSLHILKQTSTKLNINSKHSDDTKCLTGNNKYLEQLKMQNKRSHLLPSKLSNESNMNLKNYVGARVSQKASRDKQCESAAVNEKSNTKINVLSNSRTGLYKRHKCITDVFDNEFINKPTLVRYDYTVDDDYEDNYLSSNVLSSDDDSQISVSEKQMKKNLSSALSKDTLNQSYRRNENNLNKRSTSSRFNESLHNLSAQKLKSIRSLDESPVCFAGKFTSTLANEWSANTINQNNQHDYEDMKKSVPCKSRFMSNESKQNLNELTADNAVCYLDEFQTAFSTQNLNKTLEEASSLNNFDQIYKPGNVASECHIDLNENLQKSNTFIPENTSSNTMFSDILNKYFRNESRDHESNYINTNSQKHNPSLEVATKQLASCQHENALISSEPTTDFLTDSSTDQYSASFNFKLEGIISEPNSDSYIDDGLPNDPQKIVEKLKSYIIQALGEDEASNFFKTTSEQYDSDFSEDFLTYNYDYKAKKKKQSFKRFGRHELNAKISERVLKCNQCSEGKVQPTIIGTPSLSQAQNCISSNVDKKETEKTSVLQFKQYGLNPDLWNTSSNSNSLKVDSNQHLTKQPIKTSSKRSVQKATSQSKTKKPAVIKPPFRTSFKY